MFTIFISLFFERGILKYEKKCDKILLYSQVYKRRDYFEYWNKVCNLFPDASRMDFFDLSLQNWYRCFRPHKFADKFLRLVRFAKALYEIENEIHRFYLGAQLVWMDEILRKIEKLNIDEKVSMCFFDGNVFESVAIIELKRRHIITLTNQHGQPVFRDRKRDRIGQGQIFNVKSDIYIAKGDFTKEQFIKANRLDVDVRVVGGFGEVREVKSCKKKAFGVFLDCPTYSFAQMGNVEMINMSHEIKKKWGLKLFIKLHPQDNMKSYRKYIEEDDIILEKQDSLVDICSNIDFAIINSSGIYVDLISLGIKTYRINRGEYFPLVTSEGDLFDNVEDFNEKYSDWEKKDILQKKSYLLELRNKYCVTENVQINLRNLVNGLLSELS